MNTNTPTKLKNDLALIRVDQAKLAAKLGDLSAEKFELESETRDKAAAVEAAEVALVAALADTETGLPADVPAARKALDEAKAQGALIGETATRLRVLDALEQRHTDRYAELHTNGLALIEQIKRVEIDALNDLANGLRNDAKTAMESTARAEALLNAVRTELNERGASYTLPPLNEQAIILACQPTQTQARAEILSALAS